MPARARRAREDRASSSIARDPSPRARFLGGSRDETRPARPAARRRSTAARRRTRGRPLRARHRRRRDQDARGRARPRAAARCTSATAGRATRTPSAPTAAVEALLDAADEAIAAGRDRRRASSPRRCSPSPAPTPTRSPRSVRAARSEDWIVVNDVVGAWATATGARPGVGVISGTGSNVFGVGPDGRGLARRRLGAPARRRGLAATGSASQSITAALRDRDGSGPPTALSDAVAEFFGVPSVEALAALVYSKPLTKGEIAAFAVETARARRARRRGRARALRARRRASSASRSPP